MAARILVLLVTALLSIGAAHAQGKADTAGAQKGAVPYVAGGGDLGEREKLAAREKEFNLKLVFSLVERNYVSDVNVVVKDNAGKSLLALNDEGPIVLAKLPSGSYVVQATRDGKTLTKKITVGQKLHTEHFRW
jgi:hypothetical protein